ncbi:unnamed protein product [Penicillium egyptiacum]|uniref:Uncharacterized protein n=1 Tax=Penicillium egyptiacum TaxID=1303716 RepID=A0A9W4P0H4_9EURO|nr:unnamed protein product [Penicillium egyptiacum]
MNPIWIRRVYLHLLDGMSMKEKINFFRILRLERERLLDSMRNSRDTTDIDTASSRNDPDPTIEITEYILLSINPTTFHQDLLGPDATPIHSIRTSFNPNTGLLVAKTVTSEHTQIGCAVDKAIDKALERMGLDEAVRHYHNVDIDVNDRIKRVDMGWGPRRPPSGCPKRPTVILEVAV